MFLYSGPPVRKRLVSKATVQDRYIAAILNRFGIFPHEYATIPVVLSWIPRGENQYVHAFRKEYILLQ